MSLRSCAAIIVTCAVALALTACGGGDSGSTATSLDSGPPLSAQLKASANANCRDLVVRTKRLVKGALLRYPSVLEARTEGIVRPGLPLMRGVAAKQQALAAQTENPPFKRYATLFDPLIVIGQRLLAAGQAQEVTRSRNLEGLLTGIGVEQSQAARAAGVSDCVVDFPHLVAQSAEH